MTANRECILLVPGLFGFAQLGSIRYFDQVSDLLGRFTPIADIQPLQPPPTGSIWRRVDYLHQRVLEKLAQGATRVHLVGHSTGGVDVRLLTNSRYRWPGGPCGQERTAYFDRIGAVVAMSAPQRGSPIATRLRGAMEGLIPALFLASIAAKDGSQADFLTGKIRDFFERDVLAVLTALSFWSHRSGVKPQAMPSMEATNAKAVIDYLDQIRHDHPLIHELTPLAMDLLNSHIQVAPGEGERELPIASFVTVAPPPRLRLSDLGLTDFRWQARLEPAQRWFYAASYRETRVQPGQFGPLPHGPWIGGSPPPGIDEFAAVAQDAVVPAGSQTVTGTAEALVFGDHLDVVGHFPGREGGKTVFDSGANFDDARMQLLWQAVGAVITRSP
jgi:hypothetical protein